VKRAYVDIPEGQIHYQTEGSGEPLLLLHQSNLNSDDYIKVMPILAKGGYRVLAMDSMGYGKSTPSAKEHPSIEDFARSVVNFLKALGISKTSIAGHHTGATIGIEVAASHPELVDKLILSGCPYYPPEFRKQRLSHSGFLPIEAREDGSHLMEIWNYYKNIYEKKEDWQERVSLETRQFVFTAYCVAGERVEDCHQALFRYNEQERAPLIKSPTLLIYGTNDIILQGIGSLIPRCRTTIIEGGGIFVAREMPNEFSQIILDFLKEPGV